eukprot:3941906-Rhodomonas_salina.6
MSGADLVYGATSPTRGVRVGERGPLCPYARPTPCSVLTKRVLFISLRASYAKSDTALAYANIRDVRYCARIFCYAMCGTELAHAATRSRGSKAAFFVCLAARLVQHGSRA